MIPAYRQQGLMLFKMGMDLPIKSIRQGRKNRITWIIHVDKITKIRQFTRRFTHLTQDRKDWDRDRDQGHLDKILLNIIHI